jgi:hypothetical protein
MPNKSNTISDVSRAIEVADLDSENRVPISMYHPGFAVGLPETECQ